MRHDKAAVSVSGLSVSYQSVVAVADVTFDVCCGEFFCITGPNGSGKSSLVKALAGVVRHDSGSIVISIPKERISYVSQNSTIMKGFPASVEEIIMTGRLRAGKILPFYNSDDKRAVASVIRQLDIERLRSRRINELSGGELRRVLIARALCSEPLLLILDEPGAGLDEGSSHALDNTLSDLCRSNGLTVIMVTHDISTVRNCADRVAVMNTGLDFVGSAERWAERRLIVAERASA